VNQYPSHLTTLEGRKRWPSSSIAALEGGSIAALEGTQISCLFFFFFLFFVSCALFYSLSRYGDYVQR